MDTTVRMPVRKFWEMTVFSGPVCFVHYSRKTSTVNGTNFSWCQHILPTSREEKWASEMAQQVEALAA